MLVSSFNLSQSFNYAPYLFCKKQFKSEINCFCIRTQENWRGQNLVWIAYKVQKIHQTDSSSRCCQAIIQLSFQLRGSFQSSLVNLRMSPASNEIIAGVRKRKKLVAYKM
jgi:hypothetical protein